MTRPGCSDRRLPWLGGGCVDHKWLLINLSRRMGRLIGCGGRVECRYVTSLLESWVGVFVDKCERKTGQWDMTS